ncbi:glycosyltransferase [Donghicola mangrovi]|uniref:Glycosyltransferase family 4 protein n=1 Tax=Donghicola mangrovi TaxID=2729614 RepID=A0A850PY29_9RHOB|nr:glycosyltransferase [Donghicola mangrovi]NVO21736.1 glycosyltransferase family 4 protein [Donghicola mangrovi]
MTQRIAFIMPHFDVGGAEHVVLRLLASLDRTRFAPVLVLQSRSGALLDQVPADVPVHDLGGARASRAILRLARLMRRERFDLTYTATNAGNLMALAALRLSGTRTRAVISEHTPLTGFLGHAKARQLRVALMRWLYPAASALVAPLPQIGEEHRTILGTSLPRFACLPNPVIDALTPAKATPRRLNQLISVGRLAPEKRFDLMIDAFALAHSRNPDLRLTIHGEGPCRPELMAQIDAYGLSGIVALPGLTHDVPAALNRADMFLCTSRLEGLGNAIIEAMAAGLPVLSVDCPYGPPHLLEDGASGALVRSDRAEDIAEEILRMASDLPRRQTYQQRGQAMAARYSTRASITAHEDLFALACQ